MKPDHPSLPRLLILAGSAEARLVATRLQGIGHAVAAWLSEPSKGPNPMPVPVELRAPQAADALRRDMARFDAVLDLSHSFDAALSHAGWAAAQSLGRPFLAFQRPGWPDGAPKVQSMPDVATAARAVPEGARVFAATGWASLPAFVPFRGSRLLLRQTHRHSRPAPYDFVDLIFGDPPFTVAGETALLSDRAVDRLICRNLGGADSRPKLDAALALDLPVLLIDRPPRPAEAPCVSDLEALMAWVAAL